VKAAHDADSRPFSALPWLAVAVILAAVAVVASADAARQRIPAAAQHYAGFVVSGVATARACLLTCALLCVLTGLALKRWGPSIKCSPPPTDHASYTICAILFVFALLLRVPTAGASFWMDEMNTVSRVIDKGPAVVLAFSSEGNNHLMNTVLMYVSKVLFGEAEWPLRLPVLLLGALTPVVIYTRLRRLFTDRAALTVAILAIPLRCRRTCDGCCLCTGAVARRRAPMGDPRRVRVGGRDRDFGE
jgi:hypothetical protein